MGKTIYSLTDIATTPTDDAGMDQFYEDRIVFMTTNGYRVFSDFTYNCDNFSWLPFPTDLTRNTGQRIPRIKHTGTVLLFYFVTKILSASRMRDMFSTNYLNQPRILGKKNTINTFSAIISTTETRQASKCIWTKRRI